MLTDSDKNYFDYVIVYKLDRFSRNRYDSAVNKALLKKNGVKLISAGENITDSPEGIILESMLEGIAEYYSAELSQKVKRGQRESRIKGQFTGGPTPYGYDVANKKIIINESESKVVKMIYEDCLAKKQLKEIVDKLAKLGIKNKYGKPFTINMLSRILRCEKYKGIVTADNTVYANIYPAIVSAELFDNVGDKLTHSKRTAAHFKSKVNYVLSGKLFCGLCGTIMSGDSAKGKSGIWHYYYKCFNRKKNKDSCDMISYKKFELEELIIKNVVEFLNKTDLHELSDKITIEFNKELSHDSIMKGLEQKQKENAKILSNLLKALENGIFSQTTNERLQQLEEEKIKIEEKIVSHSLLATKPLISADVFNWFNDFKNIDYSEDEAKERLIGLFVNRIVGYKDYIDLYLNASQKKYKTFTKKECPNLFGSDNSQMAGCLITYPNPILVGVGWVLIKISI